MVNLKSNINIKSIHLNRVQYQIDDFKPKKESEININFRIDRKLSEDKKSLDILMGVLLEPNKTNEESGSFRLLIEYKGKFEAGSEEDITLEEFARYNAPSIIMPYIREAITDLSGKAGFKPFILPPISIMQIVEEIEKVEKKEAEDIGCQVQSHGG